MGKAQAARDTPDAAGPQGTPDHSQATPPPEELVELAAAEGLSPEDLLVLRAALGEEQQAAAYGEGSWEDEDSGAVVHYATSDEEEEEEGELVGQRLAEPSLCRRTNACVSQLVLQRSVRAVAG